MNLGSCRKSFTTSSTIACATGIVPPQIPQTARAYAMRLELSGPLLESLAAKR
jgi:hypothetical protein